MTNENAINILRHLSPPRTSKAAFDSFRQAIEMATEALKEPKVIRCKDCDFWAKQKDSLQGRCALMGTYPTGNWFCGNAERKTIHDECRRGN